LKKIELKGDNKYIKRKRMTYAELYIGKKNSLRDLSDSEFERVLPLLASELETNGFLNEYENISKDVILKDWKSLKNKKIEKDLTSVNATCVTGMKIIRKYMPHFYDVRNYKNVSVKSLWNKENLEKALSFNRKYHSTPYISEIIRSLSFTNGLGKITIYRPILTKIVVSQLENINSVLDISVGWGGRMLGSSSLDKNVRYVGIEPCKKTYDGLCKIKETLGLKNVQLINKPAEIALFEDSEDLQTTEKFDLALTSPPYFNLEIYSDEETQSLNYGSYENWIENFLKPVIINVLSRVKYSAWSVKNFKTDKKYNLLDDIIKIHEENDWEMDNDLIFTMSNSKRPGVKKNEDVDKVIKKTEENTYVFVKM
jgi:hypothetical protein